VSLTPLTTKKVDFIVEYLCKYEATCKKALTRASGAHLELFDEKTGGRKSRDRVLLKFSMIFSTFLLPKAKVFWESESKN
jgi:hypothetical protein